MAGRKASVPPTELIKVLVSFKDQILEIHEDTTKIAVGSKKVWSDISELLNYRMSSNAIHTFVQLGRHGILDALGLTKKVNAQPIVEQLSLGYVKNSSSEYSNESNSDIDMPVKKFTFTFHFEEWQKIQPEERVYKKNDKKKTIQNTRLYYVLPKGNWTPLLAEHFWVHTELACCLTFKRAKVYPTGKFYIKVIGRCSICDSHFEGIVSQRPSENAKVLMQCTYKGYFYEHHNIKKRRMIGPAKENALKALIEENLASETFREIEANRLIKIGAPEPSILPSGNALRILKHRSLEAKKRHVDVLTALSLMREEEDFKDVIRGIGIYPFFIHYHCSEQLYIYRNYCRDVKYPKLIIDATGSVVKKFKKFGIEKTKNIYLYEALAFDTIHQHGFTVSNMLSEKHNNATIFTWLSEWLNCNVQSPKETVCDMSLALLSAITHCFTQYSSLNDYIQVCADLSIKELPLHGTHWIPRCFIRVDVAHFLKLTSKWIPLKTIPRRAREVILRTIGQIIKCNSISDVKNILFSLFIVIINETDGYDHNTNLETPCEKHKKKLIEYTSIGIADNQFEYITDHEQIDEDVDVMYVEEEYEQIFEQLENNPFQKWAEVIYENSKQSICEGNGINAMYIPTLVPLLIKCMKLLPLWSGIMIPVFGYGSITASSAAVESSFKKLKTITFKPHSLPVNIEEFLEQHISSLRGASLIHSTKKINTNNFTKDKNNENNTDKSKTNICPEENNLINLNKESDFLIIPSNSNCSLCRIGNLPSENGSHKCIFCDVPVHALPTCSKSKLGRNDLRICFNCWILEEHDIEDNIENNNCNNLSEENRACESWNRKNARKSNSYLVPNPHLRHLDLNNLRNIMSLPILKNGSRSTELKNCKSKALSAKIVMTNTCAFDSLAHLIMVSYCDSRNYSREIDSLESHPFFEFVKKIVKHGITSSTYSERADIIINKMNPELQHLEYNTTLVICDSTVGSVIQLMFNNFPSVTEYITCSFNDCELNKRSPRIIVHITYQTNDGTINNLQQYINNNYLSEQSLCGQFNKEKYCDGIKKINSEFSSLHLFIDVLYWEGEDVISKDRTCEAAAQVQIRLNEIPQILLYNSKTYELRGVISFNRGRSSSRNTVGHYIAYGKRGTRNWQMFDDLKKKATPVKETTVVLCEFLIYTI